MNHHDTGRRLHALRAAEETARGAPAVGRRQPTASDETVDMTGEQADALIAAEAKPTYAELVDALRAAACDLTVVYSALKQSGDAVVTLGMWRRLVRFHEVLAKATGAKP